jgi:hypothetical protein
VLTRENAQRLVEAQLASFAEDAGDCVVVEHSTIERSFGWVFFYNSREFVETGNTFAALAGNAPFIVNRFTGAVVTTGTAQAIEYYLSAYEASLAESGT